MNSNGNVHTTLPSPVIRAGDPLLARLLPVFHHTTSELLVYQVLCHKVVLHVSRDMEGKPASKLEIAR